MSGTRLLTIVGRCQRSLDHRRIHEQVTTEILTFSHEAKEGKFFNVELFYELHTCRQIQYIFISGCYPFVN